MVTIRPTKTLARQLGIQLPTVPPPVPSRVADWSAHSFIVGRQTWLIFCNTASLYTVLAKADGVTDGETLARRLAGMVLRIIRLNKFSAQAGIFTAALDDYQWAPIPDRSTLGSINEMIRLADAWLDKPRLTPELLSKGVNEAPMGALGMNSPAHTFASLSK